jgi:voltage-gated sodium channel
MIKSIDALIQSRGFSGFIVALIVISGLLVGLETYPMFTDDTRLGYFLNIIQNSILVVFAVEILLRILAFGKRPWLFFAEPWNVFDIMIVGACLLPLNMHSAGVVRLARILRSVRMITVLPRLRLLVSALLKSIPSLGYIGVLLGLHFYIYAVIGTITFQQNDPIRFGSLHVTATTLFQVLTLEGWNEVRDTQVMGSDITYDDAWKTEAGPERVSVGRPIVATLYFMSFILLGTMIMLNLFTGVIISSMEEAQEEVGKGKKPGTAAPKGYISLADEIRLIMVRLEDINNQLANLQNSNNSLNTLGRVADAENKSDGAKVETERGT